MSPDPASRAPQMVFELCAESAEACAAGESGGAHRLEICTDLDVGGLSPSREFVGAALSQTRLPVHVLLRPSAASFVYSPERYRQIECSLRVFKEMGVAGFVLGLLTPEGRVDREHTRALVQLARPLPVTFHRAFDEAVDLQAALEEVIATGCARVLTSGGAADVVAGAASLARLVRQAGDRIQVAAGGGLRLANAAFVAGHTGVRHLHGSLREPEPLAHGASDLAGRTRAMVRLLKDVLQPEQDVFYTTAGTGTELSGSPTGR